MTGPSDLAVAGNNEIMPVPGPAGELEHLVHGYAVVVTRERQCLSETGAEGISQGG